VMGDGPVITPVSHVVFAVAAVAFLLFAARRRPAVTSEPVLVG
jgi:hypothetical protein